MATLPELLFSDFNVYRQQTRHADTLRNEGKYGYKFLKPTPERMKLMEDLVRWCRERQIEPRVWMFSLFKGRNWLYPPPMQRGHLMSEKFIPRFQKMKGFGFFRRRQSASRKLDDYDPNRDINGTVEALKFRYASAHQQERCLSEMLSKTLGYHPESQVCQGCSKQKQCVVQLQSFLRFDIIALRTGKLSATEAADISHA